MAFRSPFAGFAGIRSKSAKRCSGRQRRLPYLRQLGGFGPFFDHPSRDVLGHEDFETVLVGDPDLGRLMQHPRQVIQGRVESRFAIVDDDPIGASEVVRTAGKGGSCIAGYQANLSPCGVQPSMDVF